MDIESVGNIPTFVLDRAAFGRLGVLLLFAALHLSFVYAQEPIYSEVRAAQPVVASGMELSLEVVLLNAFSERIAAPEAYEVVVEVYKDSSAGELVGMYDVTIAADDESTGLSLPTDEAGTFSIVAVHPALISRELFVQVYDPAGNAVGPTLASLFSWPGVAWAASTVPTLSPPRTPYKLTVLYPSGDEVRILANGSDRARLQFFLADNDDQPIHAPEDIEIILATNGTLTPERIIIPKGETGATAFLRSSKAGLVYVDYRGTIPAVKFPGDKRLGPFRFDNNKLILEAVSDTSLVEPVILTLKLLDVDGKPLKAGADREVTVVMVANSKGRGVFKPVASAVIKKDSFQKDVTFIPTWPGRVELLASSAKLASAPSAVNVSLTPVWLLVIFTGGVVGALVGLFSEPAGKNASRTSAAQRVLIRLFVGVVAGALLYWAYLFGILLPPLPSTANAVLFHSLTAFFVPLLGAFAGIGVLAKLLRNFGLDV